MSSHTPRYRSTIVGNLVEDPELRFASSGIPVANLRVAVTQRIQQDGEWRDGDTSFSRSTCGAARTMALGWDHGGMGDGVPPVDLASLAAAANRPGALWRLDGEDLQANLVWLGPGDRIQPHRNDEVDVLMVGVSGRGELTLDGQVHPLGPMVLAHLPRGAVRAVVAVDGPLAYLSVHRRRRAGLQLGQPAERR